MNYEVNWQTDATFFLRFILFFFVYTTRLGKTNSPSIARQSSYS